jgi:hypothetical protein
MECICKYVEDTAAANWWKAIVQKGVCDKFLVAKTSTPQNVIKGSRLGRIIYNGRRRMLRYFKLYRLYKLKSAETKLVNGGHEIHGCYLSFNGLIYTFYTEKWLQNFSYADTPYQRLTWQGLLVIRSRVQHQAVVAVLLFWISLSKMKTKYTVYMRNYNAYLASLIRIILI